LIANRAHHSNLQLAAARIAQRAIHLSRGATAAAMIAVLTACGSAHLAPVIERDEPPQARAPVRVTPPPAPRAAAPAKPAASPRGGAYYKDDGPGDSPPPDLDRVADALPRVEPLHRFANNPYNVFGQDYVPMKAVVPFRQSGIGSWYGRKFHGQKTSSGEVYDMYAMTAAHPTLPIPSYVRVSNQQNGQSVVVRVNDRGPFHAGRIIDLSFAAAFRLGYVIAGSTPVQVELLQPEDIASMAGTRSAAQRPAVPLAPVARAQNNDGDSIKAMGTAGAPAANAVYLQLGAFSSRDNAESFRSRVYREVSWLRDAIEVMPRDGIFRLHLGPYRDRGEAAGMAERLRRDIELNPVFVSR